MKKLDGWDGLDEIFRFWWLARIISLRSDSFRRSVKRWHNYLVNTNMYLYLYIFSVQNIMVFICSETLLYVYWTFKEPSSELSFDLRRVVVFLWVFRQFKFPRSNTTQRHLDFSLPVLKSEFFFYNFCTVILVILYIIKLLICDYVWLSCSLAF